MANALVVVAPTDDRAKGSQAFSSQAFSGQAFSAIDGRPRADFLAQLIATSAQAPQTRLRRRAEPQEAIAAYDALGRALPPRAPLLSRSL